MYGNGFSVLLNVKFLGTLEGFLWLLVNLVSLSFSSVYALVTVILGDPEISDEQQVGPSARKRGRMGFCSLKFFKVDKEVASLHLVIKNPLGGNVQLALGHKEPRLYMPSPGLSPMLHLPGLNHMMASLLSRWG